jgi:Dynamin family
MADVARICEAFQISTLQPQLRAYAETARNRGVVDIAVLGQFKAGKSSFLNHLIGTEVLPVGALPVTAVVVRLSHGEEVGVQVRLHTGETVGCPLANLAGYVTEEANPQNVKGVESVEVRLPALAPYRGIRFVDTPGLGSIFSHNTQASMDWLPKVGGALVAIGVNQPFGEQDLKLLLEASRHTPEALILLTKADLVTEGQLEAILEFTEYQATQHIGRHLLVLPFSTHPDFEFLRRKVRDHLLQGIAGRHEELFLKILAHKDLAILGACREYLLLAQKVAVSAAESHSSLREILRNEQAGLRTVKGEIGAFTRDIQTRARSISAEHFQKFRGEVTRRLRESLQSEMAGWKGNLARRSERFERWLETSMREEMSRVREHGRDFLEVFLMESQSSLQRRVRGFQDRLAGAIQRALGIAFEGARFHAELSEPRQPDIHLGKVFDTQVDLLWFLVPMGIFGPLFERHFLKLLPWEVEKHLSRLSNQWAEAANTCIDGLVRQAMDFMQRELATLESLTGSAEDRREEIREALEVLEGLWKAAEGANPGP